MRIGSSSTSTSFSKREADKVDPRSSQRAELNNPSLIVGWLNDAGKMGANAIDYLLRRLVGESLCEIDPTEFFSLNGISTEDDVVQMPAGKFYACPENDLLLLKSNPPDLEWHKFLSQVLDIGAQFHVKELHVVGGMITSAPHTTPRKIMGTCNSLEAKMTFLPYDVVNEFDYQTPAGQKPTLNSYMLWAAHRRKIPGISLWVPVPFYLTNVGDCLGQKIIVEFFNRRFNLGMGIEDLEDAVKRQHVKIADLRAADPQVN
jgi:proteasome assembly chaperone (PAC2) family protein